MIKQMSKIIFGGANGERQAPSLDGMLEPLDNYIKQMDDYIKPAPESMPRTPFNSDLPAEKMSLTNMTMKQRLQVIPKMLPLMYNMQMGARLYRKRYQPKLNHASKDFIKKLEDLAYQYGVSDIAYVKVPQNAIFKGKGIPEQYAIIFTVEMEKEPIDTSPSFESQLEVMRGYKNMAVISSKLTNFLRGNGYSGYPGTALGGATDYVYLAELAGLGAIGYHGLLISPKSGARLRINTIYTNIENLPIADENEHLWVRDFCAMCKKCVRKCPVDAIYDQPEARGDGGMQTIDHKTCRDYFTQNNGCGICLAICPFSQVGYDKVQSRFKGNPDAPQFRLPQMQQPDEQSDIVPTI